jgi:MoxR-like ATPase
LSAPIESAHQDLRALCSALERVIVGQQEVIANLVTAFFAGGHLLIEGLPGLGKTHLAKALSGALGLQSARIQCTPDLMPSDITGTEILDPERRAGQAFTFRRGPIFAQLVLVDEINRATPRTQSALLEAMQELQVTYAGTRHPLPTPFCVIATQNPIELEGTFPLPEAQLDRFLFKLKIEYPSAESLRGMLDVSLDAEPSDALEVLLPPARIAELAAICRGVLVTEACKQAAIALVMATQPAPGSGDSLADQHLRYGASPRALQALLRSARVRAVMAGRAHLDFADLEAVAISTLRHRVLLKLESELEGVSVDQLLEGIVRTWRARI